MISLVSIVMSGAPVRVHAVDISALFIAFVVPGVLAINKNNKKQFYIWLFGAVIGLLYWDVLSAYVIVKKEILMGWYIVYPAGVVVILLLQLLVKFINKILPYNNQLNQDAPKTGAPVS